MCNEIECEMLEDYLTKLKQKENKETEKPISVQITA